MTFGERLKHYREQQNLTQEQLAEQIGVAKTTITGYEKGNRTPDVAKIKKLARALKITGDELLDIETNLFNRPSFSAHEYNLIEKYRELDKYGQDLIGTIIDKEYIRIKELMDENKKTPATKTIPLLGNSFAAGSGEPDFGNMWTDYEVAADSKAEFAIKINGDSMEPYLPDGSIAFGRKETPSDGDVAALLLDGEFLVKQVCQDILGNIYLFSLNRKRADADVTIWHDSERSLYCFGTIIMEKQIPLP